MKRFLVTAFLAAFAVAGLGGTPAQSGAAQRPWERAQAVVRATDTDASKGGIQAIRPHVADLEDILANAGAAFSLANTSANPVYVLVDGQAETLAARQATKGASTAGTQVITIENPYPLASFFLGTYYNEIGRPEDALRALDAGLALPTPIPGSDAGETRPIVLSERGIALASLKRWEESLASYDRGLAINGLAPDDRAVFLRGRGVALIELGRLDDAEKAYRDSLMAEPNNPRALQELTYIARLRAGGPTAPTELSTTKSPR